MMNKFQNFTCVIYLTELTICLRDRSSGAAASKMGGFVIIVSLGLPGMSGSSTAPMILTSATYNFIKKETLAQVFSCEFCEIFKNTFFTEQLRMALILLWKNAFN